MIENIAFVWNDIVVQWLTVALISALCEIFFSKLCCLSISFSVKRQKKINSRINEWNKCNNDRTENFQKSLRDLCGFLFVLYTWFPERMISNCHTSRVSECVYSKLISLFYSMQRDMMHYNQPDTSARWFFRCEWIMTRIPAFILKCPLHHSLRFLMFVRDFSFRRQVATLSNFNLLQILNMSRI